MSDILVVGCGPAGLGAAIEAAKSGARVTVIDENDRAGGQLYKQIHKFFGSGEHYAGVRGFQIADILLQEARTLGVEILLDTRALGLLDNGMLAVRTGGKTVQALGFKKLILATGAKENALAFPGWTLPGVMTAGAAQTFSNVHGTLVGNNILMVGSGNVGLIVSYQLMQAGATVQALVEAAPAVSGYQVHAGKIQRAGVPILTAHTVVEARGKTHVEEAVIAQVDEHFRPLPGTEKTLAVDTILLAVGLNPRIELAQMLHCQTTFEGALGGIFPLHDAYMRSSHPDVYVCGDIAGVEEANTALEEGRLAGLHAAIEIGFCRAENGARLERLQQSLCDLRSGNHARRRLDCKARIVQKGGAYYA